MEVFQQAMVPYYDMTLEETHSRTIFVLNLDACQVVKGQKVERTSLMLMSRALKQNSLEGEDKIGYLENNFHRK